MFQVLLIWTSLKDVVRERERKRDSIPSASRRYHQKKRKEREKKHKFLAVARLLLLTANLLSTSIDRLQ